MVGGALRRSQGAKPESGARVLLTHPRTERHAPGALDGSRNTPPPDTLAPRLRGHYAFAQYPNAQEHIFTQTQLDPLVSSHG